MGQLNFYHHIQPSFFKRVFSLVNFVSVFLFSSLRVQLPVNTSDKIILCKRNYFSLDLYISLPPNQFRKVQHSQNKKCLMVCYRKH